MVPRLRRKRGKNLSVLLIPDDNTEPITFKLSFRSIKLLSVVSIAIIIHIILGGVFYWRYAVVNNANKKLEHTNKGLLKERDRIYKIYADFMELEKSHEKIKNVLGVTPRFDKSNFNPSTPVESSLSVEAYPESGTGPAFRAVTNVELNENLGFLFQTKSRFHDLARNIPTFLPVEGVLTNDFRKSDWYLSPSHLGIDIAAKTGSIVRAAGDGIVVFANWTFDLGNLIIIAHGSGFFTYYGHNQKNLVTEKSFVKKGQPIALLGTSGKSSGPHLHFELWKDGIPLDPKDYILRFQKM